ncbi:MAG: efflux RND transporter periplasmic adaptor subunit [Leptolyngbyaceae bacterium]|nr:efflux RND transporter periplasmic adaptor subunit [Leptolyngbyaceae bacterium]
MVKLNEKLLTFFKDSFDGTFSNGGSAIVTQDVVSHQPNNGQVVPSPQPPSSHPPQKEQFPTFETPQSAGSNGLFSGQKGLWLGLAVGLGLGVGIIPRFTSPPVAPDSSPPEAVSVTTAASVGQAVTVAVVEQRQIPRTLAATGTVVAADLLPILAKAPGLQIQRVWVDEGDRVLPGQTLATLDQSVLDAQIIGAEADLQAGKAQVTQRQAALAQAKARLAEAEANLERYRNLTDQGAVSQQEFDTRATTAATAVEEVRVAEANISSALADVRSQEARIQQLRTQLGQTVVTAPAGGVVAERFARVGDVTSGSEALFTIIRDRLLELDLNIAETQLPGVQIGDFVAISSDADPNLRLQGRVKEIAPLIDPQTREAIVTIALPAAERLRPGMFLKADLTTAVTEGLTIPAAAVLPQADGRGIVYRLGPDNQAQAQTVELGELIDPDGAAQSDADIAAIEIRQGLQVGDRIVVKGVSYLKDGDRVNVVAN